MTTFICFCAIQQLSENEQVEFLDSCKGNRFEVLFKLALASGLRRGELLALTWNDVNFHKKTITVKKALSYAKSDDGTLTPMVKEPKSRKGRRTVPLIDELLPVLQQYKADGEALKQKMGKGFNPNNLLFVSQTGTYIQPKVVDRQLGQVVKAAYIDHISFHGLRHAYVKL